MEFHKLRLSKFAIRIILGVGFAVGLWLMITMLFFAPAAKADVGDTGGGSGCSDVCTSYMSAWNLYYTSSAGPMGDAFGNQFVKNSDGSRTTWAQVRSRCSMYNSVWVFEVYGGTSTTVTAGKGFNYLPGDYDDTNSHNPQAYSRSNTENVIRSGVNPVTVQEYYDALPADQKAGFTWGSNVAWFCYNYNTWIVKTSASADKSSAKPGDTITWTHGIKNEGPLSTTRNVTYYYQNRQGLGGAKGSNHTFTAGKLKDAHEEFTSNYVVKQDDVNTYLCRITVASPKSFVSNDATESSEACVFIPYNYSLDPTITGSQTISEGADRIELSPVVTNAGPTKSRTTNWEVTMFAVPSGSSVPAGGNSAQKPVDYYGFAASTVAKSKDVFAVGSTGLAVDPHLIGEYPIGTKICYGLSVEPRTHNDNRWRHSQPHCLTIGKKPKVQLWGGDLRVGSGVVTSNIRTSITTKHSAGASITYGSWGEYGVLASGIIQGMGSGAAYYQGRSSADICTVHLLTFTNAQDSACTQNGDFGNYSVSKQLLSVIGAFPVSDSTPTYSSLDDTKQRRVETATQPITISGGMIEKGDWLVINAPLQTVTITGNITYTSELLQSLKDIPQLVIIANKINIRGTVTNIDAWLVTTGEENSINTCSDYAVSAPLNIDRCSSELRINGPVITDSLYLRRTAGAGTGVGAGEPAEIINLRPDAYLWSYRQASEPARASSIYTRELPPRF